MDNKVTTGTSQWVSEHVSRYKKVQGRFEDFGEVLNKILQSAARKIAPLAIVQTRTKEIPSYAEKIIRKRHLYTDPVLDLTDLCGGRVIVHTSEQVHAFCRFIEEHFEIDWDNSQDVSQRLRPTEFGYRSVHYIVSFRAGVFPSATFATDIPKRLLSGMPKLITGKSSGPHPYKAEIQVRTILEHAWADIGHDMTYKSPCKVPVRFERSFAAIAAVLEGTDREFARIQDELQSYLSEHGKYMPEEEVREEIERLTLVLEHDIGNAPLACRIADLAMAIGEPKTAIEVLKAFRASDYQPAIRNLGIAMCQASKPGSRQYRSGQKILEEATKPPVEDPEGLRALADTYRHDNENRARSICRRAFELDPTHPECLAAFIEYEIAARKDCDALALLSPTLEAACDRCRKQIEAEVNLPSAYLHLAKFRLLLGQPYESLEMAAKAISLCTTKRMLSGALDSLKSLRSVANSLPGHEWLRKLFLVALAVRYPSAEAKRKVCQLATPKAKKIEGPVLIIAGGCDQSVQEQIESYQELLVGAFEDFSGTILSGGTKEGIAGLVGDVREHHGKRIRTIGYVPGLVPTDATIDRNKSRYSEIRKTEGTNFSAIEPLQNWIDLVCSGISPCDVKLIGINGGSISGVEYRIAAAFGAKVVLLQHSGREAARILTDPDWNATPNILSVPTDPMTILAFVGLRHETLPDEIRDPIACEIHESFRGSFLERQSDEPSLAPWESLVESLKDSNRAQADDLFNKLRIIGCDVRSIEENDGKSFAFTKDEIEMLAEIEHGRWMIERLLAGWQLGEKKDVERKINPCLVAWDDLPEEEKDKDRDAIRAIPELLAGVGLEVYRT